MAKTAVSTADLARVLERALARRELTVAEVARRSGLTERQLYAIQRGTYKTTSFGVADRLLCALGEATAFLTAEVRFVEDGRGRANRRRAQLAA
jgi:transcriptional regulator with XRE-family HTH domain